MGNQHSGGVQICSRGVNESDMTKNKIDQAGRIEYGIPIIPKYHLQRIQEAGFQAVPQQQIQEEAAEIPLLKIPEQFFELPGDYEDTPEEPLNPVAKESHAKQAEHSKDYLAVFEGLYGNVVVKKEGTLLYTDMNGMTHNEDYDRDAIGKIFPMGISYGGLTKSIWFKNGTSRDEAFDFLTSMPPSYNAVMNNPSKYVLPEDDDWDDDAITTFDGVNGRKVIVHAENLVLFTDIDDNKHCLHFNPYKIKECFPFGIHGGDLPRAIWFDKQEERDECFLAMRLIEEKNFSGLYGTVFLHSDSQIEFTSLPGDRVKCFFEPSEILETFPNGISYGGLPKTIWFTDKSELKKCIEAMRAI